MAASPDGKGYWMVASDGGMFSFGDALFHGSAAGIPGAAPVVGMATDTATGGYWLISQSRRGLRLQRPVLRWRREPFCPDPAPPPP